MIVYISLLIFYFIVIFIDFKFLFNRKSKLFFCLLLFLPLIILGSFKNVNVGIDTSNYYVYYQSLKSNEFIFSNFEKGFRNFSLIFARMQIPFTIYLFICYSIIYVPFMLISFKWISKPSLVSFSLFLFMFTNFSFSALRQSMAIGLCFFGFLLFFYFYEKRTFFSSLIGIISQIIFIVFAFYFHKSALIFFAVPIICLYKNRFLNNPFLLFLLMMLFSFLSANFYGAIFQFINPFIFDAPRTKSFFDIGFSSYICFSLVLVSFVLENILNCLNRTFYFESSSFKTISNRKVEKKEFFTNNLEIISQNALVTYLILICLLNVTFTFKRIMMYFIPFFCFSYALLFNEVISKKIRFIFLFVSCVGLIIYAYFATIRTGYLNVSDYHFGFYY